jgi:hypothetical protein
MAMKIGSIPASFALVAGARFAQCLRFEHAFPSTGDSMVDMALL